MGVEERAGIGGAEGVEMGALGAVERAPDVVNGVRSRISGKVTLHEFFDA